MADSAAVQATSYPLAAFNFRVTVGDLSMGFAEVSGLTRGFDTLTYRHGLSVFEGEDIVRFRVNRFSTLTLKRGVVKGLAQLRQWLDAGDRRPLGISLCDEQGSPVVTWRVQRALPVKLETPAFVAASNEVAVETLSLMVSGISVETH